MGKVPLTAEMALDGHDEWLPVARVLPRVKPEVHLALPASAEEAPVAEDEVSVDEASAPAPSAPAVASAPSGEPSHVRARNTCVFWPAPAPSPSVEEVSPVVEEVPAVASEAPAAVEQDVSFVGEIVEGELIDDDEWKRATVRKRPAPLPKDWRQRTVLCAPTDEDGDAVADANDVEAEGPITERMGAPETDRMPNVGEPNPEEAAAAQMRAWQATTQQRRIARPAAGTPQHVADSRAQGWADQPWAPRAEPNPDQPFHQQPWVPKGNGEG